MDDSLSPPQSHTAEEASLGYRGSPIIALGIGLLYLYLTQQPKLVPVAKYKLHTIAGQQAFGRAIQARTPPSSSAFLFLLAFFAVQTIALGFLVMGRRVIPRDLIAVSAQDAEDSGEGLPKSQEAADVPDPVAFSEGLSVAEPGPIAILRHIAGCYSGLGRHLTRALSTGR